MTHTRTYKIIEHFKSGKCVMRKITAWVEVRDLNMLIHNLHAFPNAGYRLINKKGRRG